MVSKCAGQRRRGWAAEDEELGGGGSGGGWAGTATEMGQAGAERGGGGDKSLGRSTKMLGFVVFGPKFGLFSRF